MINTAPPASNSVYGSENCFDMTKLIFQVICVTMVQWSWSCLHVQINWVRLPATLFSVSLYRFFFPLWSLFLTLFFLKLKIHIDPSAWPTGSAVRVKEKRPKGKIVFKKKRYKETENSVAESRNRVTCSCKQLLDHCTSVTHMIFKSKVWTFIFARDFKSSWFAYCPSLRPEKYHKLSRHVPPLKQLDFFQC